jgi:hypothetical protein
MHALTVLGLVLALAALFVRRYSLPPGPDRRGGTLAMPTWPDRPFSGSPRADCLGTAESDLVIPCPIGSVTRSREAGLARWNLPFCLTCFDLSQRIALIGRDPAAVPAKQSQIARFGW